MSEAVERVARALCKRCGVDPDDIKGGTWDGGSYPRGKPAWHSWAGDARAAIEALREPDDAMVEAARELDVYWSYESNDRPGGPEDAWRAMIDAALASKAGQ